MQNVFTNPPYLLRFSTLMYLDNDAVEESRKKIYKQKQYIENGSH